MNSHPEANSQYRASREIDDLLDPGLRPRDRLGKLARAMLAHQRVDVSTISNAEAISRVLSPREPVGHLQFFAAVFLRLLSVLPREVHDLDDGRRVLVLKLLGRFPELSKVLKIDEKAQGYERLRAFERAAGQAHAHLTDALAPTRSLAAFEQARQRVMRVYENPLVRAIAIPFLPHSISKPATSNTLSAVQSYITSEPRRTRATYSDATECLATTLQECIRYDTCYVREFFRPFFAALLDQVTADFETSPLNLPGRLSLIRLDKNYPFTVPDAAVRLAFAIENRGPGIAFDVGLEIATDDDLFLAAPSQFLDQIDSEERVEPVQFSATVARPTDESVPVFCTLTWKDGDGTDRLLEQFLELPAQPGNIPWDELRYAQPYSLEPVKRAKDLVGRSDETAQLISKLRAESVGSFYIYGQKRVGKTSVAATLEDMPELHGITILNLETGSFIGIDAGETIDNLGTKLCTTLLQRNRRLSGLSLPDFAGSLAPLDGFLTDALHRDPSLRLVIVLDEFDELPPSLYRKGDISHAFFLTLRSVSAKGPVGFVLVGGEKMAEILGTHGEVLNKFWSLRLDYLDKESQWADFVRLVREPVAEWATIADDAVTKLYDVTAGNPFFTKFVCSVLVEDMKKRRDAYVTAAEMDRAIATAVDRAGINNFQHFWKDGVAATSDERIEQEQAARRRVMSSLGAMLRSKERCTVENIARRAAPFGLAETDVRRVLAEFEKRRILVETEEEYSCKVGLFERWLRDEGASALDLTLAEEESLRIQVEAEESLRVKGREISALVECWGHYRGREITDLKVRNWLDQFDTEEHRRIVFKLLEKLRFYSGGLIREKLRDGHGLVLRELAARGVVRRAAEGAARKVTDNTLISFYGEDGKRGQAYAKMYADENKLYHERIVAPRSLEDRLDNLPDVSALVFVDDFVGTGRTATRSLRETLSPVAQALERRDVDVFLISVSGFSKAAEKVGREMASIVHSFRVSVCDPLDDSDKCFSADSAILRDPGERSRAEEVVRSYGRRLFKRSPLGLGNCQALVVFENTCPNNSLPIIWATGPDSGWEPLFSRP